MRIFALSDLHTDFKENVIFLKSLCTDEYHDDTLIVAGDISEDMDILIDTLKILKSAFKNVFFAPGNHELWLTNEPDSVVKFDSVISECNRVGIHTAPQIVDDITIYPLQSWYDSSLASGKSAPHMILDGWVDFHRCKWPFGQDSIADYFYSLNKFRSNTKNIVTFSHFVPRIELLPSEDNLTFKELPWVAGSQLIEKQIREIGSKIHIFGHTHIDLEMRIDGVTYISNSLKYPDQRVGDKDRAVSFKEVKIER